MEKQQIDKQKLIMEKLTIKELVQRIMNSLHIIVRTWTSRVIFLRYKHNKN